MHTPYSCSCADPSLKQPKSALISCPIVLVCGWVPEMFRASRLVPELFGMCLAISGCSMHSWKGSSSSRPLAAHEGGYLAESLLVVDLQLLGGLAPHEVG